MTSLLPSDYLETLDQIKNLVLSAKSNSLRAVNYQVVNLYWETGRILSFKTETGWGRGVVEQLAGDITAYYPSIQGFSASNLWRMKKFYETYKDNQKLVSATREISWTHNHTIFEMVKDEQIYVSFEECLHSFTS
jgi:hypothetical protein